MKHLSYLFVLLLQIYLLPQLNAEEATNPYANIPAGAMPAGLDFQKLMQTQQANEEKKKKKRAERAAISKAIADEELEKAKADVAAGASGDPYAIAEVRTRKRMAPIYEKWKKEDAAETAPIKQKAQKDFQQYQQTGDHVEFSKQYQDTLRQMGIDIQTAK